jgi:hypothetical protein
MVGVEQGYRVCVLRIVRGGIDVMQRVLRIGLGAILCEVEGFVVLDLVGGGFEKERYGLLVLYPVAARWLRTGQILV